MLQVRRGTESLKITLAPEFQMRHEHVDYHQLVRLADKTMGASEREMLDVHLHVCASCREDVQSFLAIRNQIELEMSLSNASIGRPPERESLLVTPISWWRNLAWKPAYSAFVILIGIVIIIGAAFLLNRRPASQQVRHLPTPSVSPEPPPDTRATNSPPSPNPTPTVNPNSGEATVALNDRTGTITVDQNGNVTGLDDLPVATRDQIAKVLVTKRLERPTILKRLSGEETGLRGSNDATPFRLIAPSRTVIVSERPTLKWEKAAAATSYTVYLNDVAGHLIRKSEALSSEATEWKVDQTLKRGKIYVWTVVAIVDGKEVVSPGSAAPEMKFGILSTRNLDQLNTLKKTRSHLALGLFYANVGLTTEARQEFRKLVRLNQKSTLALKLLRSVETLIHD